LPGVAAPIRHYITAFFHQTRTGPAVYVSNAFSNGDARRSGRKTVQFRLASGQPTPNPVTRRQASQPISAAPAKDAL
jgi:hypothetical protein